MDKQKQDAVVSARVPQTLKDLVSRIVVMDAHINESDFLRDALREKIRRDAPHLFQELFQGKEAS